MAGGGPLGHADRMRVIGIDACRAGWAAVLVDDGEVAGVLAAAALAPVLAAWPGAAAIGIDMPLGLVRRGWRDADRLAAARLGRHRSRVFAVPPAPVWDEPGHAAAVRRCRELTDPPAGFSRQAWNLKDKIREANELDSGGAAALHEVHPELAFAALGDGLPVAAGKKTWNGQMTRRRLLDQAGLRLPDDLAGAQARVAPGAAGQVIPAGLVPPDDILDAAAAAWSAGRIARGEAVSLPDPPGRDQAGRPLAIWF